MKYNIPLLYLDTVNFAAGWKERNSEECTKIINNFMDNKSWVIDGNYTKFNQEKRLKEADKIILMSFSRLVCFSQAFNLRSIKFIMMKWLINIEIRLLSAKIMKMLNWL